MRKASIAGPLILILIGTAFLVKNVWPEIRFFETVMTYWPFLLIGWGVLRLIEILFTWQKGAKLPVAGVSGGEWALIIVLSVIGSSVWGVQRFTRGDFGKIRIRGNGSDAGHNGLKNINELLQTQNYPRLRFGIGNSFPKGRQIDFVLGHWSEEEKKQLPPLIEHSVQAVESFSQIGIERTMNFFNK